MKIVLVLLGSIFSVLVYSQEVTPTERFEQSLAFADDMDFRNMDLAIKRQLRSYNQRGLKGTIRFGNTVYPREVLRESLILLQQIVNKSKTCTEVVRKKSTCLERFNKEMNESFDIYRPIPGKRQPGYAERKTKFTSYYSPDFNGSRVRTARFSRPIYAKPKSEDRTRTRVEIDFYGALAGKGLEIFWVEESLYDIYLLHVQGGGRIRVHDAKGKVESKYLSLVGNNSQPFQMIHKYMLQQGYIPNGSIANQRNFLTLNPHKQEEIFGVCPSYIYFRESDEEPYGVHNIPLTVGRSMAIDIRIYKTMGMINFVRTVRAVKEQGRVKKIPFSRFFIAQDTGGAIRGNARCDLYFGYGPAAELTAYSMNELGEQYMLIKKKKLRRI